MYELRTKICEKNEYEVIVLGGGPAGCAAAVASARNGAKTLLVEAGGYLGGMGTTGLVPCFGPYGYNFDGEVKRGYGGIAWEVLKKMANKIPFYCNHPQLEAEWVGIDPEVLKLVYDEMMEENGVDVLFHARICGVDADDDGNVKAVLIAACDGLTAYRAKVYVDGTGNGLTAVWAGAEAEKGDEDGDLMPATHCFTVGNVQEYAYLHDSEIGWYHGSMHPGNPRSFIHKVVAEGKHPLIQDTFLGDNPVGPSLVGFSAGHIWDVDSTDAQSLSKAILKGRKVAWDIFGVTKEHFPQAFGGAHMMATANMIGHREGYRVKGDYELRVEDYIERKSFPDEIAVSTFEMDIHAPKDPERVKKLQERIGDNWKPKKGFLGIPYRCLTPKGLKNVLVAGRSISCERIVLGSVRIMPVCLATGEAAGVAAALAVGMENCDVHQVDTDKLRGILRQNGAIIR